MKCFSLLAVLLVAAYGVPVQAQEADATSVQPYVISNALLDNDMSVVDLDIQQVGDITYVTGGVGRDETMALQSVRKEYNLQIMNAGKIGEFVDDVHLLITDKAGVILLETVAGPLFYAKLPAGSYKLVASYGGKVNNQTFYVGKSKTAYLHFTWK